MNSRPCLLLSAYQCGPGQGSVSQIGWEWYQRLARRAQVTLVTHIRNKKALESQPPPSPDAEVIYIDTEAFAGPLYRLASRLFPRSQHAVFLISSLDFFVFDRKATSILAKMQQAGRSWDLAHMVTPVSPVATPTLYRLGMPLVLGPWNGGLKSPTTFPEFMSQDSAWMYPLRNFGKLFDLFNRALSAASIILTATDSTDRSIPSRYRPKCVRMLENGVDLSLFQAEVWPEPPTSTNPLRILFVGRLIPMKGVPMLIEAMSQITNSLPVELTIIGDGPERELLERQAAESGVSSRVRFVGAQSLTQVSSAMRQAHVFCLPSVRESGGAVLLEAMAAARPVIAVKYGGPAEVVNDEVGYAIEPVGREYVVKELIRTLRDVAARPGIWKEKGIAGRARAEREFDWDAKVETALNLYRKFLGTNGSATSHDSGHADADVAGAEADREALITHS